MDMQTLKKTATCQDLLGCLYNLKPTDLQVLLTVAKNPNTTLDQIAQTVQRDRSSIHRILSKLLSANLVTKETKTIKGGGYYHTYSMVEPEKLKRRQRTRKRNHRKPTRLIESFECGHAKTPEA